MSLATATLGLLLLLPSAPPTSPPTSPPAAAGNVLRVGPAQPFATVTAALAAAVDGDVLLVDPGAVPAFDIDGLAVAIFSSGGAGAPFTVVQASGAPAIRVRNLGAGQHATVAHFAVAWASGTAPAVSIEQCAGSVRLADASVLAPADLPGAVARAAVECVGCATVWCSRLRCGSAAPRLGSTATLFGPPIADNAGLCAVYAEDSSLCLDRVDWNGFDNAQFVNGTSFGGDALRLVGACHVSLVANGSGGNLLRGGRGARLGGSAVHLARTVPGEDVDLCGSTLLLPGAGATLADAGGEFAIDNDRGIILQTPQMTVTRAVVACVFHEAGTVAALDHRIAPGGTAQITVATFFARTAFLAMSADAHLATVAGVSGRAMFDWTAPTTFLLAAGTLNPPSATLPVPVPPAPALYGLTVTLQAVLAPPNGTSFTTFSFATPDFVTIAPLR